MSDGSTGALRHAVFADTSYLFGLVVTNDQRHRESLTIHRSLLREGRQVVTSNLVMIELHSLMTRRVRASFATTTLFNLESSSLRIIRATEDDEVRVRNILRAYADKGFSLLDATSFAVMERLGLDMALSLDRHFA